MTVIRWLASLKIGIPSENDPDVQRVDWGEHITKLWG